MAVVSPPPPPGRARASARASWEAKILQVTQAPPGITGSINDLLFKTQKQCQYATPSRGRSFFKEHFTAGHFMYILYVVQVERCNEACHRVSDLPKRCSVVTSRERPVKESRESKRVEVMTTSIF